MSTADVLNDLEQLRPAEGTDPAVFAQLKAALAATLAQRGKRIISAAPAGEAGLVHDLRLSVDRAVLSWTYFSRGDYNQDSQVGVSDITPIGQYFNAAEGGAEWEQAWLTDGNADGMVTVSDITPIGVNFAAEVGGYQVVTAETPEGPFSLVGEVPFEDSLPESYPRRFEFAVPTEFPGGLLFVRAADRHGDTGMVSAPVNTEEPQPATEFSGPEDAPLMEHLEDMDLVPQGPENWAPDNDPETGTGLLTSRTRLCVIFSDGVTVGEANALLHEHDLVIAGIVAAAGVVALDLPWTESFELLHEKLTALSNDERIAIVAADTELSETRVNNPHGFNPGALAEETWVWNMPPTANTGAWGMEAIRAPQAWNLFDFGVRANNHPRTIVYDVGFNNAHPEHELDNMVRRKKISGVFTNGLDFQVHGMFVAGIVGAEPYNNVGICGVNPLLSGDEQFIALTSAFGWTEMLFELWHAVFFKWPDTRVLNISMGYNWGQNYKIDINANSTKQKQVIAQGSIARVLFALMPNTMFVIAAGNDSKATFKFPTEIDAKWASPWAWAGLATDSFNLFGFTFDESPNVLVVEATNPTRANPSDPHYAWQYTKSDYSNVGGHVAAPGTDVMSVVGSNFAPPKWPMAMPDYMALSGTSFSAPFVTGMLSYLASLDPTLTVTQLRVMATDEFLTTQTVISSSDKLPTSITQNAGRSACDRMIDAFAAMLEIDDFHENLPVHRALVDVDDWTRDGNLRTAVLPTSLYAPPAEPDPNTIPSNDERRGDGLTTMKDFRAFRDNFVYEHSDVSPLGLDLDGPDTHFKKDYNWDGAIGIFPGFSCDPTHPVDVPFISSGFDLQNVLGDGVHSRYDFNGDGTVASWNVTAPFKIDPDNLGGTSNMFDVIATPGLLRDVDVLCTSGNWSMIDTMYDQNDEAYNENISVIVTDEGVQVVKNQANWHPRLFLLANRDSAANVDNDFKSLPDYLHSADLHFWIDWPSVSGAGFNCVQIVVMSHMDAGHSLLRTGYFNQQDPAKFVLTVPIWTTDTGPGNGSGHIEVHWMAYLDDVLPFDDFEPVPPDSALMGDQVFDQIKLGGDEALAILGP